MDRVIMRIGKQEYGEALNLLDAIETIFPEYAKGWNKRTTFYYLLGRCEMSTSDIEKTLDLEPRHFGALNGLGPHLLSPQRRYNSIGCLGTSTEGDPTSLSGKTGGQTPAWQG